MSTEAEPKRRYDKGERRLKHVGKGPLPTIEIDDDNPKKVVGKCPSPKYLDDATRDALLDAAIAAPNGDRELTAPKKLYVVHEGAIYEAQTSDGGVSYHGYPFKGKLSRPLLTRLEEMAKKRGCLEGFNDWVRKNIERHGERR